MRSGKKLPNIRPNTVIVARGEPARGLKEGGREERVLAAVRELGRATAESVYERVRRAGQRTKSAWQDTCWILRGFAQEGVVEVLPDRRSGDGPRVLYVVVKNERRALAADGARRRAVPRRRAIELIESGDAILVRAS
jgi:hypothetical protein